jgi:LEA14-like dessication related protein
MKKGWTILIAVLVLLIAGGLFIVTYYPKYAQNLLIPDIEQIEALDIRVGEDSLYTTLTLRMQNKGVFKMNLDSILYKINFDTMRVLSKVQDLNIVLKPGDADTFKLPVAIPFKKLVGRIKQLQARDSADIKTEVEIMYNTKFGNAVIPHEKTSRIAMPRPPDFELEKVHYEGRDKKVLNLVATVKFVNKGNLNLMVTDLAYRIVVRDHLEAKGLLDKTVNIIPHTTKVEELPVKVKLDHPLKTLFAVLTDKDLLPYSLVIEGIVSSGKVMHNTKVTVTKKGMLELKK